MGDSKQHALIDPETFVRTITRLAHEIAERNHGIENLVLLGIRTRGVPIAERLREELKAIEGKELSLGILDVTMYRDDVFKRIKQPSVQTTEIHFNIDGKVVVVVDDVLFTGRTVRAALDAIIDFGRPTAIQLAVLVDRGHRELPIRADYVGKNVPTALDDQIRVTLSEIDGEDGVFIVQA